MNQQFKDYDLEIANFSMYTFGPIKWGTKRISYFDNGVEISHSVPKWEHHENVLLSIPNTRIINEYSVLGFGPKETREYETTWLNIPPVVAEIECVIGHENPISVTFYYRDKERASKSWVDLRSTTDPYGEIIYSEDNKLTMVRPMDNKLLFDPDSYIRAAAYLKKIQGLHLDRNSVIERWSINWIRENGPIPKYKIK